MGCDHKHCKSDGCKSKPLCQSLLSRSGGVYIISKSGHYHLKEDVKGTISIQASDVCLDLCCHVLDANGAVNAIIIDGGGSPTSLAVSLSVEEGAPRRFVEEIFIKKAKKLGQNILRPAAKMQLKSTVTSSASTNIVNICIHNGSIVNSSSAAILVKSVFDLSLSDLSLRLNAVDSIRVSNSDSIKVSNVNFSGESSGERALFFEAVNNITIHDCNATKYLSTIGAIVSFLSCNCMAVKDVNVCGNTKTSGADVEFLSEGTAFVFVDSSSGVTLTRVKVNNNTINNTVPVSDPVNNFRTAEAIIVSNSNNCSLNQCETSDNVDIAGNAATTDTEDFIFCIIGCNDVTITDHKGNRNTCPGTLGFFSICSLFDSFNLVLDGCQFNNNHTENLELTFATVIAGIWSAGFFVTRPHNVIIRNCQVNYNRLENGGVGRTNDEFTSCIGIYPGGFGYVLDNCQFNNNSVGDAQPFTGVFGIESNSINEVITNCTANFNTGGGTITCGITVLSSNSGRATMRRISNCTASSNGRWGLLLGDTIGEVPGENILIENCTFHKNGGDYDDCAGIIAFNESRRNPRNVTIRGCHISDTFTNVSSAYGIKFIEGHNIVIDTTDVHGTSAKTQGYGILLEGVKQAILKKCEVYEMLDRDIVLLRESGAGPSENEPYLDFTLDISMRGGDIVSVEFSKDSSYYGGVDTMYFYLEDLEITNPAVGPIVKPLAGAPLGTVTNGTFFVNNGLKFSAVSFGPWEVVDLNTASPPITPYSGDAPNERVIRCGFQEAFIPNPGGPGGVVASFNNESSLFTISTVDPDPNRVYTFKLLLRNSSEESFDFLTVKQLIFPVNHGIRAVNSDNIIIEDSNVMKITGDGIVLDTVTNSKILRSQAHSISTNGFELIGENSKISLIENIAMNNDKGFVISDATTLSLLQDNRAVGNVTAGFEQDASGAFSTAYIGNEAQNDLTTTTTDNFSGAALITKISLQTLKLSDGTLSLVNGNAVLGARVVNLSTIN